MEGSLTRAEFDVLAALAEGLPHAAGGEVLARLEERTLVSAGALTDAGLEALEPYRVARAVVTAAGFGKRMVPVTLERPKPLVRVNGKRIVDSVLDALLAAGIDEIYLVRGYLAEQFDELLEDYPTIRFIENPLYDEANNVSSIAAARDVLANAYVCEADLVLRNPSLITKYQYGSNYLGVPVAHTDDWCFLTDDDLFITDLLVGGEDCHHMYGISYWTERDGGRLGHDAARLMETPGGRDRYLDEIALRAYKDDYKVYVRECSMDDVAEIDTFEELVQIDPSYASWTTAPRIAM